MHQSVNAVLSLKPDLASGFYLGAAARAISRLTVSQLSLDSSAAALLMPWRDVGTSLRGIESIMHKVFVASALLFLPHLFKLLFIAAFHFRHQRGCL